MNTMTCDEVADLIDLYAAHECAPDEARAVMGHINSCADCREALTASRQMLALFDIRFKEESALQRIGERLRQEVRPRRSTPLPWLPRLAAVAALLLVTFGLGMWLVPTGHLPLQISTMQLVVLSPRDRLAPEVAHGKRAMQLDVPGPDWETKIMAAKETGDWPPPPRVDLALELRNTGSTPVRVEIGGGSFECVIDISGGRVIRHVIERPEKLPFAQRSETIAAGGSLTLRIERLASQVGGRVVNLYPERAGKFTLRVRLRAVGWREGVREAIRVEAGPVTRRLE